MATRFRKNRTRKMKSRKTLKTRKQRGSGIFNMFRKPNAGNAQALYKSFQPKGPSFLNKVKGMFTRKEKQDGGNFMGMFSKKPLGSTPGPSAMAKNMTMKNNAGSFKMYTANAVGMSPESRQEFKNRMRTMKKGGDMASFLSKGKSLLNKVTPQSMKNKKTFLQYLNTLDTQVMHKLNHEQRMRMKNELLSQLKQNEQIANEKRRILGESAFGNILTKISKIRNYIEKDTSNNNTA